MVGCRLMFAADFDPVAALAAERCPRCGHAGLVLTDHETYYSAASEARIRSIASVDPSVYAQCAECQAVMEWPAAIWKAPEVP